MNTDTPILNGNDRDASIVKMARRVIKWMFVALTVIGLFLTACDTPASEMRDPFFVRSESEDGIIVEWSGYTEGYQPGHQPAPRYEVDLRFENESDGIWEGQYCIQLVDEQALVATLGQQEFVLNPDTAIGIPHALNLPDGLTEGAYGLAFVVHQPKGATVNSIIIRIGDTDEVYRSQESATKAALAACPPLEGAGISEVTERLPKEVTK